MEKIVFECESVTPIFMYGADGKTPELRPASIKGVMRFWWRAINGNKDISILKKAESEIFGSIKNKVPGSISKKSKIFIRVKNDENNIVKIEDIPKIPYLFYPFYLENQQKEKSCFKHIEFKIIISSNDKKALKEAAYSFILLSIFGGLGSRNRRGGGNFMICNISKNEYKDFIIRNLNNIDTIYEKIKNYFYDTYKITDITNKYSNISDLKYKISNKNFNSWDQALKDIENKYKNFRKKRKILKNASFGLPIIFENKPQVFTEPEFDRRASPLVIKILKIKDKYYWFVFKFKGEFLPKKTKIGLSKDKIDQDIDEHVVNAFFEELK